MFMFVVLAYMVIVVTVVIAMVFGCIINNTHDCISYNLYNEDTLIIHHEDEEFDDTHFEYELDDVNRHLYEDEIY